jgi:ACS family hexuronate transporter-like MFS transporter
VLCSLQGTSTVPDRDAGRMSTVSGSNVQAGRIGRFRLVICGLIFAAMVINYIDRQMIGVLKPTLQQEFGWTDITYGDSVFWFQAAYAVGFVVFGRLMDGLGARRGYTLAMVMWTIAHMAHAAVRSATAFMAARFFLGLGESGSFPASLKAVADWFPGRERALAIGIFNAGSNIGAILTPLLVPAITLAFGWRMAFLVTGIFSLVWLPIWWAVYQLPEHHPRVGAAELAHIRSDAQPVVTAVPWGRLLTVKETWAFALGKFLIDPIWWMFLFWLPDFFAKRYHLDLVDFGPPLAVVYVVSDLGSIAGGWLSSRLIRRGATVNVARKVAMLIAALLVVPVMFAMYAHSLWLAVAIVGLATAGHQGFSANLYTFPSDVFPKQAVASVVGFGGTAGAVGGMLMSKYAGWVLDSIGSYTPIFVVAGTVYLLALAVIHVLSPRMEAVRLVPDRPVPTAAAQNSRR